jgi:hypothetical protein
MIIKKKGRTNKREEKKEELKERNKNQGMKELTIFSVLEII